MQRNLALDAAVGQKPLALFDIRACALYLVGHAVSSARRVEQRAVPDFVPAALRAEKPIKIRLSALCERQKRVCVAIPHGAKSAIGILAAVPTDLRLSHPKRLILDASQKVVGKRSVRQLARGIVMVELYGIELFVDVVIAQIIVNHHVRADVFAAVPMQNFRLLVHVRFYLTALKAPPRFAQRRVTPLLGVRRLYLVERVVGERPPRHAPRLVELAYIPEPVF